MFGYDPERHGARHARAGQQGDARSRRQDRQGLRFVAQFDGAQCPLIPTKPGTGTGDEREVDTITGATISSRAVIGIINNRIERCGRCCRRGGVRFGA
jgi:hypothetical protein